MPHLQVIALILILSSIYCQQIIPTIDNVENARETIESLIVQNEGPPGEFPLIAGFVRLAFHDCVGAGHCDGCINHDLSHNGGLKFFTDKLDALYGEFSGSMSRADFYALASMMALEMSTENSNDKFEGMSDFKVGRIDCPNSPMEDRSGVFPAGRFNMQENIDYFSNEFNFSPREVVALMGAHTLGRAKVENSGYEGVWVNGRGEASTLNNRYYREFIVRIPWVQTEITFNGVSQFQWQLPNTTPNSADNRDEPRSNMLLNSDMALSWEFSNVDEEGKVSCMICPPGRPARPGAFCCGHSTTHSIAQEYSDDNAKWVEEFTAVFLKMINMNTAELQPLTSPEVPETPMPRPVPGSRPGPGPRPGSGQRPGRRNKDSTVVDQINDIEDKLENFAKELEEMRDELN